jgi:hypothetical protein
MNNSNKQTDEYVIVFDFLLCALGLFSAVIVGIASVRIATGYWFDGRGV